MKIAVSGATGKLGSQIIKNLTKLTSASNIYHRSS